MNRVVLLSTILAAASMVALAQRQDPYNPVNPNLGGSPFPAGAEPSRTHTVTGYWTTQGGLTTEIHVKAHGERATQFDCWKDVDGNRKALASSIAADCSYRVLISGAKENPPQGIRNIVADGHGAFEIRVYGFKREDFANPPLVTILYSKDGKVVGETKIISHPVPEKFNKAKSGGEDEGKNRAPQPPR